MEKIANPDVAAVIRALPVIPVERIDASVNTSRNHVTACRLFHTVHRAVSNVPNPGAPPTPPSKPTPLPARRKGDDPAFRQSLRKHYNTLIERYNREMAQYKDGRAQWDDNFITYTHSLNSDNLPEVDLKVEEEVETEVKTEDKKSELDFGDPEEPIAAAEPLVVFTHGRNSTLENAHVTSFCKGFGREAPILLFQDTRAELERISVFRTLLNTYPSIKVLSGRSAGARNAARASLHAPVKRLIFFTYPLVRGLDYRYADLIALGPDIEVLFVVGDGDALAVETQMHEVRHRMRAKSWWIKVINANHNFGLWPEPVMENMVDIAGQLAAVWAKSETLDPELTELTLQWRGSYEAGGQAEWTGWSPPPPDSPKPATHFRVCLNGGKLPPGGGSFQFTLPGSGGH